MNMKIKNAISSVLAVLVWAIGTCSAQSLDGRFLIEGKLKNVPDGIVIKLFKNEGRLLELLQKDTVMDGRFSICDTIGGTAPQKLLLIAGAKGFPNMFLDIWAQPGKRCTITGEDCLLPLWHVDSEVAEQRIANDFMALCVPERKRMLQWMAQESDLFYAAGKGMPDAGKVDSLCDLYEREFDLIGVAELNYMQHIPVTAVWLDKLAFYHSYLQGRPAFGQRDLIRSLYGRMSESDKQTASGQVITGYMNLPETVGVGDDMADGDLYDMDGNVRHLSEFRGKYIMLDFWSQGCGPCIWSLPEVEKIAERYQDKMEVVSICQDYEEAWKKYVSKKQMKGNQWNELRKGNTGLAAAYGLNGIPHYVMISPSGKVMCIWSGYSEGGLISKVEALIESCSAGR